VDEQEDQKPSLFDIAFSIVAAAFGVQSDKNRKRDFAHGNPLAYIAGGLIFTLLLVLSIVGIVMLVLPQ
jgi:hypothetical protein